MTDYEIRVLSELSALKAQMDSIIGIGQPGRLDRLEERVALHERTVQRMKGMGGTFSVLFTVFHIALDLMKR
jgi:hypothetical protein